MTKDWLIRTKNNHILGPVTKDKIKQLISNGSIKGDDEVCSGNGYWVYIREQDLIARFIFGDEAQSFNPVQEIDPVLDDEFIHPPESDLEYPHLDDGDQDEFGNLMPSGDDLEYPDLDSAQDSQMDATLVSMNLKDLPQEIVEDDEHQVSEDSEDYVQDDLDVINRPESIKKKVPKKRVRNPETGITKRKSTSTIPRKRETQVKERVNPQLKKSSLTKNVLYIFIILFFVFASLLLYYRKTAMKQLMPVGSLIFTSNAYAQVASVSKKKNGLRKTNLKRAL